MSSSANSCCWTSSETCQHGNWQLRCSHQRSARSTSMPPAPLTGAAAGSVPITTSAHYAVPTNSINTACSPAVPTPAAARVPCPSLPGGDARHLRRSASDGSTSPRRRSSRPSATTDYSAVACPGRLAVTFASCSSNKHQVKLCAVRQRAPSTRTSKRSGPPRKTRNRPAELSGTVQPNDSSPILFLVIRAVAALGPGPLVRPQTGERIGET
jgi:hypothetical protein